MARKREGTISIGDKQNNNIKKPRSMLPCDNVCPKFGSAGIFCDVSSGAPYACVLNQTNISQNNNKFFIIQVLKDFTAERYYTWIRWGRVGYNGQTSLSDCAGDAAKAISIFEKKFVDKTKNNWSDRESFDKYPDKYDLVKTEIDSKDEEVEENESDEDVQNANEQTNYISIKSKSSTKSQHNSKSARNIKQSSTQGKAQKSLDVIECKLELAVQELIRLICDVKAMEAAAADVEFDTDKTPLGKITADQIKSGYAALSQISNMLNDNMMAKSTRKQLVELSSQFYTRIPHCTGMRAPPVIDNHDLLAIKVKMLEVLGDIKLGMDLLRQSSGEGQKKSEAYISQLHPIERMYQNLRCDISALPIDSNEFAFLEKYILSTHASTHSSYTMDVQELYTVNKDKYLPGYTGNQVGNRVLLFHGSRLSNWAGILSQGLRIAPPEAPVTGYMFGKGVYFADMSSKSANYCFATPSNPYGLLLLCEVALGTSNFLVDADYNAGTDLPKHTQSVKGLGRVAPQKLNISKLADGTIVPMGPGKESNKSLTLNYNEFIVYDTKQIRLRYLAKIKFNFQY